MGVSVLSCTCGGEPREHTLHTAYLPRTSRYLTASFVRRGTHGRSTRLQEAVRAFMGVEFAHDRSAGTVTLTQRKYLSDLEKKYAGKITPSSVPVGNAKATREAFDKLEPAPEGERLTTNEFYVVMGENLWPANMTKPEVMSERSNCETGPFASPNQSL